jgi:hypothetical protein
MAQAKARRTIRANKRDSWRQYVSRLNHKTPLKKLWDMVRHISGKHLPNPTEQLNTNNSSVEDIPSIANTLGSTFAHNS